MFVKQKFSPYEPKLYRLQLSFIIKSPNMQTGNLLGSLHHWCVWMITSVNDWMQDMTR